MRRSRKVELDQPLLCPSARVGIAPRVGDAATQRAMSRPGAKRIGKTRGPKPRDATKPRWKSQASRRGSDDMAFIKPAGGRAPRRSAAPRNHFTLGPTTQLKRPHNAIHAIKKHHIRA